MTYTVKYKHKNNWFWKTLKKIKGDGILEISKHRWFVAEDETRYEIPMDGHLFEFTNGRFLTIKQNMEKEAGQKIPVNSKILEG